MADDRKNNGKQDRAQVNVHEPYEVEHLAKMLGVMPEDVRSAEDKVGKSRAKIEEYIKNKRR